MRALRILVSIGALLALSACKPDTGSAGGNDAAANADGSTTTLPTPQAGGGSVTGMPDAPRLPTPTTVEATIATTEPQPTSADAMPAAADPEETMSSPASAAIDVTSEDAVTVLRDYYVAINAGDYKRAWRLWDDGGRASGQSSEQFAAGFAQTAGVSVEIGRPGPIDAGAGQRHVRVPIVVTSTLHDGRVQRFVGDYLLHASVVEGAPLGWRIRNGNLRLQK